MRITRCKIFTCIHTLQYLSTHMLSFTFGTPLWAPPQLEARQVATKERESFVGGGTKVCALSCALLSLLLFVRYNICIFKDAFKLP